jgi:hypothetical protein
VCLVTGDGSSAQLLLPLSLLLWSVLGLCAGYWLARAPAPVHRSDRLLTKIYKWLIFIIYMVAILALLLLTCAVLVLTLRALALSGV